MAKTTKRTETANDAYLRLTGEIELQLKALDGSLAAHQKKHEVAPKNWGYAGDLGHVRELLDQVLGFLDACDNEGPHCDHADGLCREALGLRCDEADGRGR